MSHWFETIRLENGIPCNLQLHLRRIEQTLHFHHLAQHFSPAPFITLVAGHLKGVHRLRIDYQSKILNYTVEPYQPRKLWTLKIIHDDEICYPFKNAERTRLTSLQGLRGECDDVLIVKNNQITDISYANIVFSTGYSFVSPSTPLLPGTQFQYLIHQGIIQKEVITTDQLSRFIGWIPINALLGFQQNRMRPMDTIHF